MWAENFLPTSAWNPVSCWLPEDQPVWDPQEMPSFPKDSDSQWFRSEMPSGVSVKSAIKNICRNVAYQLAPCYQGTTPTLCTYNGKKYQMGWIKAKYLGGTFAGGQEERKQELRPVGHISSSRTCRKDSGSCPGPASPRNYTKIKNRQVQVPHNRSTAQSMTNSGRIWVQTQTSPPQGRIFSLTQLRKLPMTSMSLTVWLVEGPL